MASQRHSSCDNYLDMTLKQPNLLSVQNLIRYVIGYKPDAIFVITDLESQNIFIEYKVDLELISNSTAVTEKTKFILGNDEIFIKLSTEKKKVHMLQYVEELHCFKWLESTVGADVNILRKYAMCFPEMYEYDNFEVKYDRPVTIIFGDYGSGKTVYLNNIKSNLHNRNKAATILYVSDIHLRKFCKQFEVRNVKNFMDFFNINLTNTEVHLLFDNFEYLKQCDEFIDIMADINLNYRNVKQWITCSDLKICNKLESKLATFTCCLAPLSVNSKINYLRSVWNIENDCTYINSVLSLCDQWYWKNNNKSILPHIDFHFSSYPLHLKMIGTVFNPISYKPNSDIDILDVYENFIKIYYNDSNINEIGIMKLCQNYNFEMNFQTNLPKIDINLEFTNIVNYLAAKWFSNNLDNYKTDYKKVVETQLCPWAFQYFFNRFLSKGHALHTAILNHDRVWDVCSILNINERDAGGRTALHLTDSIYHIDILLEYEPEIDLKDNVFDWTPLQVYNCNGYLNCIDKMLTIADMDCEELNETIKLTKVEVAERFQYCTTVEKLDHYAKFLCENFIQFKIHPESLIHIFNFLSSDLIMVVLNNVELCDVFPVDEFGKTALFYAVENYNLEAVQFLVNNLNYDVHHRCNDDTNAFHLACDISFPNISSFLLEKGVDVNVKYGEHNSNAFTDSCRNNNVYMLEYLVREGADSNVMLSTGETPIELACKTGSTDVVRYILQNVEDLKIKYEIDYDKLLFKSIWSCIPDLVELILKKNVNIHKNYSGTTILHIACKISEDINIVKYLIKAGANVNALDNNGCTPLFDAYYSNTCDTVKILIAKGCNLWHRNMHGETALHVYTKNCLEVYGGSQDDYYDLVESILYLVANGADINARTPSGDTPLHFACRNSNMAVVRCLITAGADVFAVNIQGESPLHLAAMTKCTNIYSDFDTCYYLVFNGVDINVRSFSGKTPIMCAVIHPDNIDKLISIGADIFCRDNDDKTLVHYLAEYGLLDKIKLIEKLGLDDGKSVDKFGKTALHYAAMSNHYDCFKYLIENFSIDINIVDKDGKMAVDLTADVRFRNLVKRLFVSSNEGASQFCIFMQYEFKEIDLPRMKGHKSLDKCLTKFGNPYRSTRVT